MAGRKAEPGISYYRMNCGHSTNKKVRLLFNEFDANGYWIWQCIIDYAYSHKGYYFDCNDDDALELFATDVCKKQVSLVKEVIDGCLRRGLFNKTVFEMFGILSSVMMQEVYLDATYERRRKGTEIEIYEELLLIPISNDSVNILIIPWNNSILPRNNAILPRSIATEKRREKKSKGEKSKVNPNGVAALPPPKNVVKKKNEEPPEPYWDHLVTCWFEFYRSKFKVDPSFKDQDPKFLKKIVQQLKKRAEKKSVGWTDVVAMERMNKFLEYAFRDNWLKDHFLLENLNKQFDVIIQPKQVNAAGQVTLPPKSLSKKERDINFHYDRFLEGSLKVVNMYDEDFDFMITKGIKINESQNQAIEDAVRDYMAAEQIPNETKVVQSLAKRFALIEFFKQHRLKDIKTIFV